MVLKNASFIPKVIVIMGKDNCYYYTKKLLKVKDLNQKFMKIFTISTFYKRRYPI